MRTAFALLALSLLAVVACETTTDATPDADGDTLVALDGASDLDAPGEPALPVYRACSRETSLGGVAVVLKEDYTSVQGTIADAVRPIDVPRVTLSDGACELLQPKTLFCDPGCGSGQTCGDDGQCVALPSNQSVGTMTISGLSAPVEMPSKPPLYFYLFAGDLPHPGFANGDLLTLTAEGDVLADFAITTVGVTPLEATQASMTLVADTPAVLDWTAADGGAAVAVEIVLNIANHGGTPASVHCLAQDTGHFEIPVSMVNALLELGYSGFPSVSLTRVGSGTAELEEGCVEFRASSTRVLNVEIPGLTSCSDNGDCPDGQICQSDLTCK